MNLKIRTKLVIKMTQGPRVSLAPGIDLKKKQKKNIYSNRYADTSKRFRGFGNLMLQWQGAVLKLIWHDLLLFLLAFFSLEIIYTQWLKKDPNAAKIKEYFELMCIYCGRYCFETEGWMGKNLSIWWLKNEEKWMNSTYLRFLKLRQNWV